MQRILASGKEAERFMQGVYSYGTRPKYNAKADAARGQKPRMLEQEKIC